MKSATQFSPADIVHDIRNLLGPVLNSLELARLAAEDNPRVQEALEKAREHLDALNTYTKRLSQQSSDEA